MRRADFGAFVAPDRDAWMSTRSDSAGVDVTLAGVDGEIERLTQSRADEFPGSWSPDGKQVVVETSQFGDSGHKVAAILDLASRRLRPLTGRRYWESRVSVEPRRNPHRTHPATARRLEHCLHLRCGRFSDSLRGALHQHRHDRVDRRRPHADLERA